MRINGHGAVDLSSEKERKQLSQVMMKNVIAVWRSDNFMWSREEGEEG